MESPGLRETLRGWAVDLALGTAGGLFLGAIGPFGSYFNGPFWQRALFQVACFWMGVLLFGSGIRLILRLRPPAAAAWAAVVVMVLVLMAPLAAAIGVLARALWPFEVARLTLADWYFEGLVTALPVGLALAYLHMRRLRRRRLQGEAGVAAPSTQGLLGARPAEVLCLQMEDHYVRVHTAGGSRLVLATLGQAIAALEGAAGLQAHRSWWVANAAVVRAEHHGRNLRLVLSNGVVAPVARSAVPAVRAAGWL
jgi:DNA-binding LytR/AlgR family response regulator